MNKVNTNTNTKTVTVNSNTENTEPDVYQVNTNATLKNMKLRLEEQGTGNYENSPSSSSPKNYFNHFFPPVKGQASSATITPPGKPFGKLPIIGGRRTRRMKRKNRSRKQKNRR